MSGTFQMGQPPIVVSTYKTTVSTLSGQTLIYRVSDGAWIPSDPNNDGYQAYIAWVAAGNTPGSYP